MPNVTIYSRTTCAPCHMIKRWLTSKNIPYTDKNVDDNPDFAREAFQKSGYTMVPIIEVGDQIVTGANFSRLSSLLTI